MDEYISRRDALEIVKRTGGDYAAAFSEISRMPTADLVEQSYRKGHISGYYEGFNDGAESQTPKIVIENLEKISNELSDLKKQISKFEQSVMFHIHAPQSIPQTIRILPPWWAEPGGKGGHGGGQG